MNTYIKDKSRTPEIIASNIQWDIDIDDAVEQALNTPIDELSDTLGIPRDDILYMSENGEYEKIKEHLNNVDLIDFLRLPRKVKIPVGYCTILDDISNFLSDTYGWCHNGFDLNCNMTIEEMYEMVDKIDEELRIEYRDGETVAASNLECEKESLEMAICIMEETRGDRYEELEVELC